MNRSLREQVRLRAADCCEYCQMPQRFDDLPFEVEHVIPEKHGGLTVPENLAWACAWCNRFKGPNLAGIDPRSGEIAPVFQPRRDAWNEHFRWDGPVVEGITAIGRTTIRVLRMNELWRVAIRESLMAEGIFAPK